MRRYNGRFIFGFDGKVVSAFLEEMIVERRVGGFVLFSRNVESADQVSALCSELQRLRSTTSGLPLFIAVDQEGGTVNRIFDGVTLFPSQMAIAATGNVDYAKRVGACVGNQLLALGINMNFAPVLDLNLNKANPIIGVRSFGDDHERVADFGAAMIEGMQGVGLISVAKHFPGLGSADQDPHYGLPVIPRDVQDLEKRDLVPFARAVEVGVSGIMVGHAHYPSVSQRPASLSERVINGLLREKLGFQGMVCTDDLQMEAIADRRSVGDAVVKACKAGADVLLVCHSSIRQIEALADFSAATTGGKLRSRHIKDAVKRIREIKEKMSERVAFQEKGEAEDGEALAREVAESAVTLVGNDRGILPLRLGGGEKLLMILPELDLLTPADVQSGSVDELVDYVKERHPEIEIYSFELAPPQKRFEGVRRAIEGASAVIMGTCNAHRYNEQEKLVAEVAAAGKPTVFIALREPYDADLYPRDAARLLTYGADRHMMAAAGKALFGELVPRGKSPVQLNL